MELSSFGKQEIRSLPQPCGANPAFNSFSKATCPTLKSLCVMLLSPAAGHHTNTVHWHAQASMVTKEGGEVGSGGWFWEVESEPEPQTQIQGGDGGGGGRSAVYVCGRRREEAHRDSGVGLRRRRGEGGVEGKEDGGMG